jgi:hypothetical protein
MRRLVLSLFAASSVVLLSACGQGGSAFNAGNNTHVDHVLLMSNGDPSGVFKVVPGGTLTVSAVGVKGPNNVIVNADINYTFDAEVAPAGTLFQNSISGVQGVCLGFTQNSPAPVTALPLAPVIPPANLVTSGNSPDTVVFVAPQIATLNALDQTPNTIGTAPASYCVFLNAHHTVDGVTGSATILVTPNT